MPYFLTTDQFADEAVWEVLAEGRPQLIDSLQASHQRLMSKASHLTSNGYLTETVARRYTSSRRVLVLLTMSVLDMPPKLHRRGDECECLGDEWVDGYTYRLHAFLKRNPSRREYERNRAQKADLRDSRLKALVFERDGGCCRYCRSGRLSNKAGRARDRRKFLQFDHVDPDQVAGEDGANFVVACARCNEHKGHRTPDEADMVLLPEPTDAERAAWLARDTVVLLDPSDHTAITDEPPTNDEPNDEPIGDRTGDETGDRPGGHEHPTNRHTTDQPRPDQDEHEHQQRSGVAAEGPGWVGQPLSSGPRASPNPGQPPRTADAPDIYTRRSRHPAPTPPREEGPP